MHALMATGSDWTLHEQATKMAGAEETFIIRTWVGNCDMRFYEHHQTAPCTLECLQKTFEKNNFLRLIKFYRILIIANCSKRAPLTAAHN